MKFSQKLVCIMLLVIAAFFAVGGAVLVNGSFMKKRSITFRRLYVSFSNGHGCFVFTFGGIV